MPVDVGTVSKLNLGCRRTRIAGFHNFDARADQDVDFVGDASDLFRFADESLEEVYASNILEHFPHVMTLTVLKEWRRVLRPGGKLWLSVPDLGAILRLYQHTGILSDWLIFHLFGEQRHQFQYHYVAFDGPRLRAIVAEAGFSKYTRLAELPYGVKDASSLKDNQTRKPICVNAVAER